MNRPQVALTKIAADKGLIGGPFGSSLVNKDYEHDGIPVIRGTNLNGGGMIGGEFVFVSEAKFQLDLKRNSAVPGDLVFTQRGTLGQVAVVPSEPFSTYVVSQSQMRLRVDTSIADPRYVYFACGSKSFLRQIDDNAIATGVPHINLGILGRLTIPLPGLPEQQAIAEVLGALDDKIAANTKLAATSALLAQSLFAAAATDTQGIEIGLVDSCSLLSRGITPKYSTDDETMVVLNQKCVRGQRVDLAPARRTLLAKVRQEKVLHQNDVLVNSTGQGTLGRVARWTHDEKVVVDSHITIVRFNPEVIDPICGGFAMLRNEENITAMAEGSTGQTELSRVELGKLTLRLPPRERQQALGHELAKMTSMENAHLLESQTLVKTRDALLPRLMSGQISIKDAEALVTASV